MGRRWSNGMGATRSRAGLKVPPVAHGSDAEDENENAIELRPCRMLAARGRHAARSAGLHPVSGDDDNNALPPEGAFASKGSGRDGTCPRARDRPLGFNPEEGGRTFSSCIELQPPSFLGRRALKAPPPPR